MSVYSGFSKDLPSIFIQALDRLQSLRAQETRVLITTVYNIFFGGRPVGLIVFPVMWQRSFFQIVTVSTFFFRQTSALHYIPTHFFFCKRLLNGLDHMCAKGKSLIMKHYHGQETNLSLIRPAVRLHWNLYSTITCHQRLDDFDQWLKMGAIFLLYFSMQSFGFTLAQTECILTVFHFALGNKQQGGRAVATSSSTRSSRVYGKLHRLFGSYQLAIQLQLSTFCMTDVFHCCSL